MERTVQPASHGWVESEVDGLDKDLAIFKVGLLRHRMLFGLKGLAGGDGGFGALRQVNSCVGRHDCN